MCACARACGPGLRVSGWRTEFPYNSPSGSADLPPTLCFGEFLKRLSNPHCIPADPSCDCLRNACFSFCVVAWEILHRRDALLSETVAACVTLLKRGQLGRGMGIGVGAATVCVVTPGGL